MERLGRWWKTVPKTIRQSLVLFVGTLVVLLGIVLLPLPGPGWVIIFFGFALLATEFAFAEKVRDRLVDILKSLIEYAKKWGQQLIAKFKHKR